MASLKDRLINVLRARALVSQEKLDEVLEELRAHGGSLQKLLIARKLVSERDLLAAMSEGLGIPPISLTRMKPDPNLKGLISRELATQYELVPISCMGQTLTVAMADPLNIFALDTLTTMTGLSINALLTTSSDIREAIDHLYGLGVEETLREIVHKQEADALLVIQGSAAEKVDETDPSRLLSQTQEAPVVKCTDTLLTTAVRMRASDLLIEPREKDVRVRFRVDGMLQEGKAPPRHLHAGIVSRVKIMAELNIAERRLPQDGHFTFRVDQRAIDIRVSILPTSFGGNVALRVLDKAAVKLDLATLGFSARDLEQISACSQRPHGMILATGPTGSGKTTTLYALLKLIDAPEKNIVTVEDPVEFELEGINQVNARTDIGLTFSASLRSILRQDPDVIMVGEIRDAETADMAIKSALTGHMVFSTLHTNSAVGTIIRLVNMGLEPFLINSSLTAVIGQRLVRKICASCAEKYRPAQGIAAKLGLIDPSGHPIELVRSVGCRTCFQSGYVGREVIAETVVMTPETRELVLRRAPARELEQVARKQGMKTLRDHGLAKAIAHVTTLEEVFRTTIGDTVET
ncbi:MAG: ATPase, T2SS/T4P/T4SS family [Candidatus Omnitrophota bacterium]|nr:ATPase, T2SS/T4P/T4SS family [Candidatus Omnitrophota bacterium]